MIETDKLNTWRLQLVTWRETGEFSAWQQRRQERREVRDELLPVANQFLAGETSVAAFKSQFDEWARGNLDYHGQNSRSVGTFLGKLTGHLPDIGAVTSAMRRVLQVPGGLDEATDRLREFSVFLNEAIEAGDVTRHELQPNRALYFASSWWAIQNPRWAVFLRPARKVLAADSLYDYYPISAGSYAPYAERMLELTRQLDIDLHDLEGLCQWRYRHSEGAEPAPEAVTEEPEADASGHRVWLIAPGRHASAWDEHYEKGITAIGWGGVGDLREYPSLDAINAAMRERRGDGKNPFNNAKACYDFAYRMQPGDIIFAKRGMREVIGAGIVTGDYRFDPQRSELNNVRDARWTHRGSGSPQDFKLVRKTLTEITRHDSLVHACAGVLNTTVEEIRQKAGIDPIVPSGGSGAANTDTDGPVEDPYTREQALQDLFLDEDEFDDMLDLLRHRRNIVLQGPPGTGKTFLASRLARVLIGAISQERICKVQFHQSMTYEDFVRGYRPNSTGGFTLRSGPFLQFCNKALQDRDNKYVMVIDEINRGNLSSILGELMLLIEPDKRKPEWAITLTYSDDTEEPTWVPPNLHLIGTMNTADRSLALVDYALRRRFAFIDVPSAIGRERFRNHLAARGLDENVRNWIVSRLRGLNKAICDDGNLGPGFEIGHSYFCEPIAETGDDTDSAAERWYQRVVRTEIVPLLREYWFDAPATVEEWREQLTSVR